MVYIYLTICLLSLDIMEYQSPSLTSSQETCLGLTSWWWSHSYKNWMAVVQFSYWMGLNVKDVVALVTDSASNMNSLGEEIMS
jgi:hypothetical protein